MIPIRSAAELAELDKQTIKIQELSSWELMERAVESLAESILGAVEFEDVCILCGPGNNGGDGLGLARKLSEAGKEVEVYMFSGFEASADNAKNFSMLPETVSVAYFEDGFEPESLLAIDALFGYGLNRPLSDDFTPLVDAINESFNYVISIDMPSGMPAEPIFDLADVPVVQSDHVLTFHAPKLSLLLPYSAGKYNSFQVLDIELEDEGISEMFFVELADISEMYRGYQKFDHKYNRGVASIIGGSNGKSGSVALAGEACMRAGAGIVELSVPEAALPSFVSRTPELMYQICGTNHVEELKFHHKSNAIGIGPGLGAEADSKGVLEKLCEQNIPLVFDADALGLINKFPEASVLTPHEGEFERMVGSWRDENEKLEKLKSFALDQSCIVVLKGAHTIITDGQILWFNSSGHPAMATAGSGDVLLGMITSLRAQGYDPLLAALIGVYVHGIAAQLYLEQNESASLLASDIASYIGKALLKL